MHGGLPCCAVKAPGFGDRRKAILEDIAVLTGANAFMESMGIHLEALGQKDLGSADRVAITKDTTTIINGAGKSADIKFRITTQWARLVRENP